jgi:hypothetical protein
LRPVEGSVALDEQVKDDRDEWRRESNPRIFDSDERLVGLARETNLDATAGRRVLGGVDEQIHDALLQARGVTSDGERFIERHVELMETFTYQDFDGLYGGSYCRAHVDELTVKSNATARDSRHIEQIIDQAPQLTNLSVEDPQRALADGGFIGGDRQ